MGLGEAGATVVPTGRRQELADEVAAAIKSARARDVELPGGRGRSGPPSTNSVMRCCNASGKSTSW